MTDSAVRSTARDAREATIEVADDAKTKTGAVADTAKTEAKSVATDAKKQASDLLGTAGTELRSQADSQAKTLSVTLSDLSRQLGDLAEGKTQPDSQMAQLARTASTQLSNRAERIDHGGIDGVLADAKRFARNRPGPFLAASIAAGLAIGRLAKHADLGAVAEHARGELDSDSTDAGSESPDPSPSARPSGQPAGLPDPDRIAPVRPSPPSTDAQERSAVSRGVIR